MRPTRSASSKTEIGRPFMPSELQSRPVSCSWPVASVGTALGGACSSLPCVKTQDLLLQPARVIRAELEQSNAPCDLNIFLCMRNTKCSCASIASRKTKREHSIDCEFVAQVRGKCGSQSHNTSSTMEIGQSWFARPLIM